jgi:hypothetical protein
LKEVRYIYITIAGLYGICAKSKILSYLCISEYKVYFYQSLWPGSCGDFYFIPGEQMATLESDQDGTG